MPTTRTRGEPVRRRRGASAAGARSTRPRCRMPRRRRLTRDAATAMAGSNSRSPGSPTQDYPPAKVPEHPDRQTKCVEQPPSGRSYSGGFSESHGWASRALRRYSKLSAGSVETGHRLVVNPRSSRTLSTRSPRSPMNFVSFLTCVATSSLSAFGERSLYRTASTIQGRDGDTVRERPRIRRQERHVVQPDQRSRERTDHRANRKRPHCGRSQYPHQHHCRRRTHADARPHRRSLARYAVRARPRRRSGRMSVTSICWRQRRPPPR